MVKKWITNLKGVRIFSNNAAAKRVCNKLSLNNPRVISLEDARELLKSKVKSEPVTVVSQSLTNRGEDIKYDNIFEFTPGDVNQQYLNYLKEVQ
jgi:primase-polymerase (primpol)-like protein